MFLRLVAQEKYFCVRWRAENGPIATIVRGRSSTTLVSRLRANNRESLFLIVFRTNVYKHFTICSFILHCTFEWFVHPVNTLIWITESRYFPSLKKEKKREKKEHAVKLLDKVPTYPISGRKRTILKLPNNR